MAGLFAALALSAPAAPAMRVIKTSTPGVPLLQNGSFEELRENRPAHWSAWQHGFRLEPGEGRAGSQGILCEREDGDGEFGASQTLTLNRTNVAPFIIRGWSRAKNVTGSPDNGYSLYVDLTYTDGTPLWGQTANFTCGTHDWEKREFVLLPDKPVQSLTLHCLFGGHTGKVWFDHISLEEIPLPAGVVLFQGVPVQRSSANATPVAQTSESAVSPTSKSAARRPSPPPSERPKPPSNLGKPLHLFTRDGLKLTLRANTVASLKVDSHELNHSSPSGFLARDFAADSDIFAFNNGACPDLNLKLNASFTAAKDHITIAGRLTDTSGQDRAVTLLFALPLDATGWRWGDDARASRLITGSGEFANTVTLRSGANSKMSRYPIAAIWNDRTGIALALDMDHPAQYRLVYHAGTKQFFIAYDFGLTEETAKFPSSADFRFVIYRFDPRWGFRAALQKFYDIFPAHFVKRVSREGVWMPFTDIAHVPGFKDFGFAFQEGAPNVAFDDQHGIASFVYVEPMSHWLAMPTNLPRTYESARSVLNDDLAGKRNREARQMAAATLTSGIHRADGQFALYLVKAPWCDGGVFTLNPDPDLPASADQPFTKAMVMRQAIDAAFRRKQPPTPTNAAGAGLDGVYLDSFEMSAAELNYRRDHFRAADVPLVFDRDGRPCQLMVFDTWEFARDIAADMHARGKLMFANAVLSQFAFPAPLLDVLGTEINWLHRGQYSPDTDAAMNFRRALCRQKPYCLLLNTDYSRFTRDLVERYFQRCLFYGIWPGFFDEEAASKDPYWASARNWYERDRALFRKYIPLLRQVTAAGWQPLTLALCDNPNIFLERFGPDPTGALFFTLLNDTSTTQTGTVTADLKALRLKRPLTMRELVSGEVASNSGSWTVWLPPHEAKALCLETSR